MTDELKHCPFCGGLNLYFEEISAEQFCVSCLSCNTDGPVNSLTDSTAQDEARDLWNKRSEKET